jgi:adenine specific DNA methylase Mod
MTGSHGLIVGVKKVAILRMKQLIAGKKGLKKKGFKKPGGVSQVPFGGTDVRHALNPVILSLQGLAKVMTLLSDL